MAPPDGLMGHGGCHIASAPFVMIPYPLCHHVTYEDYLAPALLLIRTSRATSPTQPAAPMMMMNSVPMGG